VEQLHPDANSHSRGGQCFRCRRVCHTTDSSLHGRRFDRSGLRRSLFSYYRSRNSHHPQPFRQ
jgi:hypothetical protein